MIAEPLLGTAADAKAPGSRLIPAGYKPGVAFALCVVAVGAICYAPGRIQHVPETTSSESEFLSSPTTQKISSDVDGVTREVDNSNAQLAAADVGSRDKKDTTSRKTSEDAGREMSTESPSASTRPTEIPPDVLKQAIREYNGLEGGARCVAAFLFDREASRACAAASPEIVAAETVVLSLYVLFFFAPFYMFPEAAVAFGAWKLFPTLEKAIVVSPGDNNVPDTMRMGLLVTALVAIVSRFWTLWKERNEPCAAGRQGSMLISIIIGFVLYMILNFLSA